LARIVIHRGKEPIPVKDRRGITVATICICGLSKRHPSCDGSHIKTKEKEQERGKISVYTQDSERVAEMPREKLKEILGTSEPRTV